MELRDAPDPQRPAELVAHEPHRVLERPQRLVAVGLPPITLTQTLACRRSGAVSTSVIVDEPDARVGELLGEEHADLLAQELVDPVGPLAHGASCSAGDPATGLRGEALDDVALDEVVVAARPMPHS